jgi:hypothetical protein
MSRKNIALAAALTFILGASTPVSAMTRDGGRGFDPIQRVIKVIKQLLHPITHDLADPLPPHP